MQDWTVRVRRLGEADRDRLLEFLRASYSALDRLAFHAQVLSGLRELIPCDIISYNEVNPRSNQVIWLTEPADALDFPESTATFNRHIPEHPLIRHYARTRDVRVRTISDFLTRTEFHRLGLYNEFYRRLGVEYQMACVLPAPPPLVIGIALSRCRRDFQERDRALLQLVSPHLVQAFHNARIASSMRDEATLLSGVLEGSGRGVIVLTREGIVRAVSRQAQQWIEKYFLDHGGGGGGGGGARRLPEVLRRWMVHQQALLAGTSVPPPQGPFVVEREGARLVIRLVAGAEVLLLLVEEQPNALPPIALRQLGLTRREAEVLAWVARGRTNSEIGKIADMSPRTVEKHLEHIFRKLGVENRTAAGVRALQATGFGTFTSSQ